ncbi:hypothetical protein [Pedobacter steynii]
MKNLNTLPMTDMPLTVKRSIELLGLVLLVAILVVGNNIIMPVIMAFFISIVVLPVYRFLIRKKLPRSNCNYTPNFTARYIDRIAGLVFLSAGRNFSVRFSPNKKQCKYTPKGIK